MKFSEKFDLKNHSQSNFDFANIRIDRDNKLFIDPTRIVAEERGWFQKCDLIIQDFFNTIFDLYSKGETDKAREYFQSSGESNELFLGYTEGFPRGNGNSEESLAKVFEYVHKQGLLEDVIVGRLEDFYVFVPEFGEDLLSDLVASLIKAELVLFTQEQCEIHDIALSFDFEFHYWNHVKHRWEVKIERLPSYNGHPIVLVPKEIMVSKYLYSSNRYWTQVVSIWRQRKHREENSILHQKRPKYEEFASKKEIKNLEVNETSITDKQYLVNMTRENPAMIVSFRNNITNTQRGTNSNKMSDEELEKFIQDSYQLVETSGKMK
ncbi:hypothetical protein P4308_13285 [Bacillus wiedmannii]|uniref:hypothetical protein n=1 Tax=Bacillus wiedmannii TaxID=1890302 RepID=UPI00094AA58C|nr:hypothetical protein [Bacillus wiedmannii]PFT19398.1 hypothetical protein COK52_23075 [Bacillus thuringiensis]MDF9663114.1 hypothetical protein [Bacillus wiedmannii]MED2933065.1 hypothetical protein [Bacillus wiedmannii]PFZ18509.1 hypothetical protein COL51_29200 [Bacillus wiedmannii]PGC60380.1 hypothetical protein COM22_00210 [Bacillus wiedmannii]